MKNLNNTVIFSQGGEHGKRVIEWWKEQGVDTIDSNGQLEGFYYGLINGVFNAYSIGHVQKANAKIIELPEDKPQSLIGRNVKGFKFEGDIIEMRKFVGKVGVIQGYDDLDNTYFVAFGDNEFYYPASLIHDHLVEDDASEQEDKQECCKDVEGFKLGVTCPKCNKPFRSIIEEPKQATFSQIIDLSNVKGVEMMVCNDTINWSVVKVVAKIGYVYIDNQANAWNFAKPIEVKKVTMQEKYDEMLEMLKKAERTLREVYDCCTEEIDQLIKEATDLTIKEANNE